MAIMNYLRKAALAGAGIMAVYASPYSLETRLYADEPVASNPDPPGKKNPPAEKTLEEKVVERINYYRQIAGLDPVVLDPEISKACQAHANYLMVNNLNYTNDVHNENPKLPGYTKEGAEIAGVSNISFNEEPLISIDRTMSTVFHRVNGMLEPRIVRVGVGYSKKLESEKKKEWVTIGIKYGYKKTKLEYITFPTDNQQEVALDYYPELPDPIPRDIDARKGLAGFPITIMFYNRNCPKQADGALYKIKGKKKEKIDAWFYSPDAPINEEQRKNLMYIIAKDPLEPKTTYEVAITGTLDNKPWEKTWQFTTVKEELSQQVRPKK